MSRRRKQTSNCGRPRALCHPRKVKQIWNYFSIQTAKFTANKNANHFIGPFEQNAPPSAPKRIPAFLIITELQNSQVSLREVFIHGLG
jgi:hypothetical protein